MQQLDIFSDSVPVQRANDLNAALTEFNSKDSRQALHKLTVADPNHTGLAGYQVLFDFVAHLSIACASPNRSRSLESIAADEQLLRTKIIPASRVMGNSATTFQHKCWSMLAKESEREGIPPEHRECFAAELYLRAHQFAEVVRLAQGIPGVHMRAFVQRWLGLGYYGGGNTESARMAALRYAWLAPQRFDTFVDETSDKQLAHDWSDFQADLSDLDATWFPAWCAHEKKAGDEILNKLPASDGGMAYHLVIGLTIRERGGLCPALYEDRARLKRLNDVFFAFYMERRSDLHAKVK